MSGAFQALAAAEDLNERFGLPVLVAAAIDDGEGGVFIQLGVRDVSFEEGEFIAATLLRDIRKQMAADEHGHCDRCAARLSRVGDALAALERDGATPTGEARSVQ